MKVVRAPTSSRLWLPYGKPNRRAAQHEALPPVGPELVGRRDGRHPVAVEGLAGRRAEGHVERLRDFLVSETMTRGTIWKSPKLVWYSVPVAPQFETAPGCRAETRSAVERQVELEEAVFWLPFPPGVGVAVGRDAEPVEHAVERVEPAHAARLPAGRRAHPGLVPASVKKVLQDSSRHPGGIGVTVARQRLDDGAEHALLRRLRRLLGPAPAPPRTAHSGRAPSR